MSFDARKHVDNAMKEAFAQAFDKVDPLPKAEGSAAAPPPPKPQGAQPQVAPATTATPATEAAPAAPKDSRYDSLAAENKALREQFEALQKSLRAAAGVKEEDKPRATVKSVEQQVLDLQAQLDALRNEGTKMARVSAISAELPNVPEYVSMKDIPDLASKVAAEQEALRVAAEERGEGATEVSVAQALASLKSRRVAEVKALLANQDLLREVGLGTSSQETSRSSSSRALTSEFAAQSGPSKTTVRSTQALLRDQAAKASRLLNQ